MYRALARLARLTWREIPRNQLVPSNIADIGPNSNFVCCASRVSEELSNSRRGCSDVIVIRSDKRDASRREREKGGGEGASRREELLREER